MRNLLLAAIAALLSLASVAHPGADGHFHDVTPAVGARKPTGERQATPGFPAAIQLLEKNGSTVIERFNGPGKLAGWAVENAGERRIFYTTTEGLLISGDIFSASGQNLTLLDAARTGPGQPSGSQERAWKLAEGASGKFVEGNGKRVVYAIIDFGCPHCKRVWEQAQTELAAGGVELRWLPVSALGHNPRAAQLFFAARTRPEAQSAFTGLPNRFVQSDAKIEEQLRYNKTIMQEIGATGVPIILFKDSSGVPRALVGAPDAAVFSQIMALR